jgi:hypothetical protein
MAMVAAWPADHPYGGLTMSDLFHLWGIFLGTFIGLLPVVDPLSAAPMFLPSPRGRATSGATRRHARAVSTWWLS